MSHSSAVRRLLVIFAVAALLTGCERTNRWQEEVQLSDGAVLRVDRVVSYRAPSGALGQPIGRLALEERLSFADPGTGLDVEWHEPRRTAAWLDRTGTQVWVIGMLTTPCASGFSHLPPWQAYMLRGDRWEAVDPADAPVVSGRNLMTTDYPVTKRLRHVSISDKKRLNAFSVTNSLYPINLRRQAGC